MDLEIQGMGIIRSAYQDPKAAPRQGYMQEGLSEIVLDEAFWPCASDLRAGEQIQVLYFAHRSDRTKLRTIPPALGEERGVFSSRSPHRPNPILICVAKIESYEAGIIRVHGLDAVDGSILVDIKGYSKGYHDRLFPQEGKAL